MDMHIGELARAAGVNIQTIRFYERQALLPKPARNSSGYRSYEGKDVERVTFIKRNQELGFTLTEIKQLIQLHGSMADLPKPLRRKPDQVRAIISLGRERLSVIDEKVRLLRAMRRELSAVVDYLESHSATVCPVSGSSVAAARKPAASSSSESGTSQVQCPVANVDRSKRNPTAAARRKKSS
jgi:MerR family mercuric resistance operon transcriptional regulator